MQRSLVLLTVLAAPAWAAAEVTAYTPLSITGGRSMAMGDAFRAVATNNDAISLNPAGLALVPHYEVDGFFAYGFGAPASIWDASIVDANTLPLAVGLQYMHDASGMNEARFSGSDLRLAVAYPVSDVLVLGVGAQWLDFGLAQPLNAVTGDAALILKPIDILTIAAVGYNLIGVSNTVLAPRKVALAAAVGSDNTFRVAADAVANLSTPSIAFDWHLGGEYFVANLLALRAGWMYDGLVQGHFISAGLGLIISGFAVDVSYRQQIIEWDDRALFVGFKVFLPT